MTKRGRLIEFDRPGERTVLNRTVVVALTLKMTTALYRLSERQWSTTTVLFRTTLTRTIKLNLLLK